MRRAILREYDKLANHLSNYVAVMNYRFMNLCVKAEPVSLLPIEVSIEGEPQKLEECVKLAKDGDYKFVVYPNYEEDMKDVMRGIAMAHPEFKQEIITIKVGVSDDQGQTQDRETRYLQLTMPEVNDERYDVLTEGVKLIYDECKFRMEVANNRANVKLAELTPGESEEDIKLLNKELEKLNNQWNEQRDKLRDAKLEEINQAYNKWLGTQGQEEIAKMEAEDARGVNIGMSMKLGNND